MSVHYSVGLLHDDTPRCPLHGPMQKRKGITPKVSWGYQGESQRKRTEFYCKTPGCHRVAVGAQEYVKGCQQQRSVDWLGIL